MRRSDSVRSTATSKPGPVPKARRRGKEGVRDEGEDSGCFQVVYGLGSKSQHCGPFQVLGLGIWVGVSGSGVQGFRGLGLRH